MHSLNETLIILENYNAASEWAAKYVRNKILKFKPGPEQLQY